MNYEGTKRPERASKKAEGRMERLAEATHLRRDFGVAGIEHVAIEGMELLGEAT
jgi:hypothetical protein